MVISAEGAFKKLKPEPVSGSGSGGGTGSSSLTGGGVSPGGPQHAGHTPTTASCPTPARRRHRTTFTQVQHLHSLPRNPPRYLELHKNTLYYRNN